MTSWSAAPSPRKKAGKRSQVTVKVATLLMYIRHIKSPDHPRTRATSLPCTCSVQPLFWSCRCGACPSSRSLPRQRDRSHSAGRRLPRWHAKGSGPAGKHMDNDNHKDRGPQAADRTLHSIGLRRLTWEELSSSAACEEVERVSSDWPRDPALARPFSNLPLPRLCGGDDSDSLATAPSSSNDKPTVAH